MEFEVIDRYSIPLEQQMIKVGSLEPEIVAALLRAHNICSDNCFVSEAEQLFIDIGGKPGDAALEIYRDLQNNIFNIKAFLQKYDNKTEEYGYKDILSQAKKLFKELQRLDDLVNETPPEVMEAIKNGIRQFRNLKKSGLVMISVFVAVILLRYFELISISWYIVFPLSVVAMFIAPQIFFAIGVLKRE
jgi:hypothetical protein